MNNILFLTLQMFLLAFVISFAVAFIIKAIFFVIKAVKHSRERTQDFREQIDTIQNEARSTEKEGEITAVIAYALHLYMNENKEDERTILTIKKVVRPYSPWSSKIYGVRQFIR